MKDNPHVDKTFGDMLVHSDVNIGIITLLITPDLDVLEKMMDLDFGTFLFSF